MARRLSVRERGNGAYEVGPAAHGPTVTVQANSRRQALKLGKSALRQRDEDSHGRGTDGFKAAVAASYRDNDGPVKSRR